MNKTIKNNAQREHYISIHDNYNQHYFDSTAMQYRDRFIFDSMFLNLNLNNKDVADLASGGGGNSLALLKRFPNAKMTGFDISPKACAAYMNNVKRPAFEVDLSQKNIEMAGAFDAAILIGGLHHCVNDLETTIINISNILKPGGAFLFCEPNKKYFLEYIRKAWYKFDRYFQADTEEALDYEELLNMSTGLFDPLSVHYFGGPAYFLILNSLISRIPLAAKSKILSPLMYIEQVYETLPWRFCYPAFIAQWRKLGT